MPAVLLDTHTWAWTLTDDQRLSQVARRAVATATTVNVSPISFYEIGQKVRLGKWPEMTQFLPNLPDVLARQGGHAAALTLEIALSAATLEWAHRDPFDRMIAATCAASGFTLVSADTIFDEAATGAPAIRRIW